ncbi:MAG TPA: hypothetical protein EYH22_03540 [Candidatus Nanopusillus sp.]|nr:hypothetical protein [Candidatus Nanopusillus sp.]
MAEYVGRKSCSAKREGWYIERNTQSLSYWAALLWASLRDYRRGYKYDDTNKCRRVSCNLDCLVAKIIFIRNILAPKIISGQKLKKVQKWCDYVLKNKRLPAEAKRAYKKAIKRIKKKRR